MNKNEIIVWLTCAAVICIYIIYRIILTKVFKKKKPSIFAIIFLAFGTAVYTVMRKIADKIEQRRQRTGRYKKLGGYEEEMERVERIKPPKSLKNSFGKWKNMNNSEKIRSIYVKRINRHIRKGYAYMSNYTPLQTEADLIREGYEEQSVRDGSLYHVYNRARYDVNAGIGDDEVSRLKKKYN